MSYVRRRLARLLAVVTVAVGCLLVVPVSQAVPITSHRTLNDTRPVVSGVVGLPFSLEYFGVVADLDAGTTHLPDRGARPFGEARFLEDGHWTAWQVLGQDGAQAAGHFTSALLPVDRATAYQVRGLPRGAHHWRAAAINTTDGASVTVGERPAGAASASSPCRSRADWGADESKTGWSRGTDVPTYFPVQTLTVHHTAGSNDPGQDYAATVRAIYSYHVQTNGWADIGYQYLIDARGTVYEGRSSGHVSTSCLYGGGDGSDFAHETGTDDLVTGAHVGGANSGNAGIALMGCFEASTECSGDTSVPPAAVDSLETLLAELAVRHSLDLQGQTHYVNPVDGSTKDVATVSGHRDWSATACPGGRLYAQLPAIRAEAARRAAGSSSGVTPPERPGSVNASSSSGSVVVSWTPPGNDGGSPVTSYQVFRSSGVPDPTTTPASYSGTALTWTDRPQAGTYTYGVRACNAVGCGPLGTAAPVTVLKPATITSASCSRATCSFAGTGTGALSWTFGNSTGAAGSPVAVTYAAVGTYTVRLTDSQVPSTSDSHVVTCRKVSGKLRCGA